MMVENHCGSGVAWKVGIFNNRRYSLVAAALLCAALVGLVRVPYAAPVAGNGVPAPIRLGRDAFFGANHLRCIGVDTCTSATEQRPRNASTRSATSSATRENLSGQWNASQPMYGLW